MQLLTILPAKDQATSLIDDLVYTAIFSQDAQIKKESRTLVREIAKDAGAHSASIHDLYMAIGEGKADGFTVPAINVRFLTYDTACIIFTLMQEKQIGPVIFEIARSEIDYTDQRPDEYAVVVLAAAVKTGYVGPVFIQGDHFQFSKRVYSQEPETEIGKIKALIKEAVDANFLNIDIDASTLVDLEKEDLSAQQEHNFKMTAGLTRYIRELEPDGETISIGGEIGHIGGKNSTVADFEAFMNGYLKEIESSDLKGISKVSVQTGSSHGGTPNADGTVANVNIDFNVLKDISEVARSKYHIGGSVQHGASTLPNELFHNFPQNDTLEIHLATGFQNIVYDTMPTSLRDKMVEWVKQNCQGEWDSELTEIQNIYKTRKKAIGPFKQQAWDLTDEEKAPIREALRNQLSFLFEKLNVINTKDIVTTYVK